MASKKILVPIDFSDASEHALKEASDLAQQTPDAHLTLMHVHPIIEMVVLDFTYVQPPDKVAEVTEALRDRLQALADDLPLPEARRRVRVETGAPAQVIIDASEEFDLIVMATGKSGLQRFLMGSVAERVVRGAHCSVLIVKQG